MIELNKIYNMDCFEGMKLIDDESVDMILSDPPYNINYYSNSGNDEYKDKIQTGHHWDNNFNQKEYIKECLRILKNNCFMLIFGCEENISIMKELGCKQILIWDKNHCGMGNLKSFGIGYEYIFLFEKGNPIIRGKRINGVIRYNHIGFFDNTIHPTQKPVELMSILLKKCSDENNIVFDGCIGSGTIPVACKQLNRNFIGFEISKEYCDIANKRLHQETLKKEWF